jgi:hypothetical protein
MALRLRKWRGACVADRQAMRGKGRADDCVREHGRQSELERNGRQPKHAGTHLMLYSRRWVGEEK